MTSRRPTDKTHQAIGPREHLHPENKEQFENIYRTLTPLLVV